METRNETHKSGRQSERISTVFIERRVRLSTVRRIRDRRSHFFRSTVLLRHWNLSSFSDAVQSSCPNAGITIQLYAMNGFMLP
eukprot:scaffold244_cov172-Amphora_coffeaeformis.AAC.61